MSHTTTSADRLIWKSGIFYIFNTCIESHSIAENERSSFTPTCIWSVYIYHRKQSQTKLRWFLIYRFSFIVNPTLNEICKRLLICFQTSLKGLQLDARVREVRQCGKFNLWHCFWYVLLACSAMRAYPTSWLINSNVSPNSGLKGFQNLQQEWNTLFSIVLKLSYKTNCSCSYLPSTVE